MNRIKLFPVIFLFSVIILASILNGFAQSNPPQSSSPRIELSGFMDAFYVYDFNRPQKEYRQSFLYNHNRHNEFNLNLGFIKISAAHKKYRANLALQAGTYVNDNYANEPGVLKNLFEAYTGVSLNKKNNLWLDAGVFSSHIGFESAISMDNWTLTRSLLAENSPYYLSGSKLTYTPNKKIELVALACNGWQRIQRVRSNSLPSLGTQVKITPSEKTTLNWSTFVGTDDPDSIRRMRYFNNLYGQFQITNKIGLITGFDIGMQQKMKNSSSYHYWMTPILIGQYNINDNWKTAVRAEYYSDPNGVIIATGTPNGFATTGISCNIDYLRNSNLTCRLEGRMLSSRDEIFESASSPKKNDFFIGMSIASKFSERIGR